MNFSDISNISSLIISIGSLALAILFYRWSLKQTENANKLNSHIQLELAKALFEIKEKVYGINYFQENINQNLLNAFVQQFKMLTQEKIAQASEGEGGTNQIIDKPDLIIAMADESQNEIKSFYVNLSMLSFEDIAVLYAIYATKSTTISKIESYTNYNNITIQKSLLTLTHLHLIGTDNNISKEISILLEGIFNIDLYSGMTFSERVKCIRELINRVNKLNK